MVFSFLVWFRAIQKYETAPYILLLDEPVMHLHVIDQSDLLNFMEELSRKYQIIYTTHSPFMQKEAKEKVYYVKNEFHGTELCSFEESDMEMKMFE